MQRDGDAEEAFRQALKRDVKNEGAYLGLAKLYRRQQKLPEALRMVDTALRLSPEDESGHYLRGRILRQLGREKEAKAEFAAVQKSKARRLSQEQEALEDERVPNPELSRQLQP
jgi:tetratricopeptide (TPR) repeat protein